MKRIFSLTRVIMKTTNEALLSSSRNKKKKGNPTLQKYGRILLFAFLFLYFGGIVYFLSNTILDSLIKINQPGLVISLIFTFGPMISLFFSVLSIPGVYYFSNDVDRYLTMPIRPWEIALAKFISSLVYSYTMAILIFVPVLANYYIRVQPDFLFIIYGILAVLIIPAIPLAMALLIVVILMAFIPFFRNKDVFSYISVMVAVAASMGASFAMQSIDESLFTSGNLVDLLSQQNSLINSFSFFFPTSAMLTKAVVNSSLIDLLLALVITVAFVGVVLVATQPLYFRGVIGIGEQMSKKKRLNKKQIAESFKQRSLTKAIMSYDIKNILRTPVYATNYFSPIVIMPVIFGGIFLMQGQEIFKSTDITEALSVFRGFIRDIPTWTRLTYATTIGASLGLFFGNMSTLSATAISREGSTMDSFLSMPIHFSTIAHAKARFGIIVSGAVPLIFTVIAVIILRPDVMTVLVFLFAIGLSVIFVNYLSLTVDVFSPNLNWTTEQQAVKGNFKQVIITLPFIFIPMILLVVSFNVSSNLLMPLYFIVLLAGDFGLITLVTKLADKRLVKTVQGE